MVLLYVRSFANYAKTNRGAVACSSSPAWRIDGGCDDKRGGKRVWAQLRTEPTGS
jgi:hypothetical protein